MSTSDADAAPAGRHHHGPCRPRQDLAARRAARRPMSRPARPAASPSISAPIRCTLPAGEQDHLHRHAGPRRPSPPCARAAPTSPTSSCWWWPPMTASCRRRSRRSATPRRRACRSSSRSTRSTSRTPTRTGCARNCCSTSIVVEEHGRRRAGRRGLGAQEDRASTSSRRRSCCRPKCSTCRPIRTAPAEGVDHRGQARARPRPGRDRAGAARHAARSATSSWPAPNGAACARWSTTAASRSKRPGPSHAGRGAGPQRRAARPATTSSVVDNEAPRPRDHRVPPAQAARQRAARRRRARHARADVLRRSRGGRPRSCRSSSRPTCRARSRRSPARCSKLRHERGARCACCTAASAPSPRATSPWPRRPSALDHRLQRPRQPAGARAGAARRRRHPLLLDHLRRDRRHRSRCSTGMLAPTLRENFLGNAEIREVFNITKVGKVAGCMVTEGVVKRGAKVRLLRDNVVIHEGTLKTLQALQGRGPRSPRGLRMRHGLRELRRHPGRRRDRVLRGRGGRAQRCSASTPHLPGQRAEPRFPPGGETVRAGEAACRIAAEEDPMNKRTAGRPSQRQLRVGEEVRHALAAMLRARRAARSRPGRPCRSP